MNNKTLIFLFVLFLVGCQETNLIEYKINSNSNQLLKEVREMIISDNYTLEEDDSLHLSTNWRKCTKDENNIPDNTIECKVDVVFVPLENDTEIKLKVMKRSSLNSEDQNALTYIDVGIILNDWLYKKWQENLKSLQKKYSEK